MFKAIDIGIVDGQCFSEGLRFVQHDHRRHQLGERCDGFSFVRILFQQDFAAPDVVHDRAAGIEERRPGGRHERCCGEKQHAGEFLHVNHTLGLQSGEQAITVQRSGSSLAIKL